VVYNDKDRRLKKSWSGCNYCDVPLCKISGCFEYWHAYIRAGLGRIGGFGSNFESIGYVQTSTH